MFKLVMKFILAIETTYSLGQQVVKKVCQMFHRVLGYTAAAMLPKQARGSFRKHVTKPFSQPAAQDYISFSYPAIKETSV